jgi:Sulfotransferase family
MNTYTSTLNSETRADLAGARNSASPPTPIFILGIAPRSGTNYLHDLIRMHPACEPQSSVLEEDFLVANAPLLHRYAQGVSRFWKRKWGAGELEQEKHLLCAKIGEGLVSFLYAQLDRRKASSLPASPPALRPRLVTKTPHVTNLELFFELFPSAPLLILVRDGRSVVESTVKTFSRPYGYAAREWASSAREILEFQRRHLQPNYLIVRYEDVYQNVESELRRIFSFLGLDPEVYDYSAAANAPVRGSCAVRAETPKARKDFWVADGVHWNPTPKPADFNPLVRWHDWSRAKHERFNWIAGQYMPAFGYSLQHYPGSRIFWSARNIACDVLLADQLLWLWRRGLRRANRIHSAADLFGTLKEVSRKMWESVMLSRLQKSR